MNINILLYDPVLTRILNILTLHLFYFEGVINTITYCGRAQFRYNNFFRKYNNTLPYSTKKFNSWKENNLIKFPTF